MISVIIPVYNAESALRICVDSVLRQSYQSFEIILIDDGSEDLSGRICDDYSEKDDRITIIHQNNQGVSAARNRGLDIAKGDFIAFVDSDDYVEPDYLKVLLDGIVSYGVDMCMISLHVNHGMGRATRLNSNTEIISAILGDNFGNNAGPVNKLFKRSIIGCLRFDKHVYLGEDTLFDVEYAKRCKNGVFINEALYHYDLSTSSISYMRNPAKLEKYLTYAESRQKMLFDTTKLSSNCRDMLVHAYFSSILNCFYQSRYFHDRKAEMKMCLVMKEAQNRYSFSGLTTRQKVTYWIMGHLPYLFPFWNAINTRLCFLDKRK